MTIENFREMIKNLLATKWDCIIHETVERTKWVILDTLFATWHGLENRENQQLVHSFSRAKQDNINCIPIIGSKRYSSPSSASLIHGTATVSNELDEGNQFAKGHPAAHIFPVAFNTAVSENVSGKEFNPSFSNRL